MLIVNADGVPFRSAFIFSGREPPILPDSGYCVVIA
jgi:hypothetical protein